MQGIRRVPQVESPICYRALTGSWIDDPKLPVARISTSIVLHHIREFGGYPITPDDEEA